jgi:hypothetical protein
MALALAPAPPRVRTTRGRESVQGLALLLVFALLASCGGDPETPEARIGALIDSMEQAVEARAVKQAAGMLHGQYKDDRHPDRSAAIRTLAAYLRRHSSIHLFSLVDSIDVSPDGTAATAVVYVAMSGVAIDSVETLATVRADLYRFDLDLNLGDGDWRILRSRWRRADISVLRRAGAPAAR